MMFAAKIEIKREPQRIRYQREIELPDGWLTLKDIARHLKIGEMFAFREVKTGVFGSTMYMDIYGYRIETKKELKIRVAKEEKYMKEYYKFHAKNVKI